MISNSTNQQVQANTQRTQAGRNANLQQVFSQLQAMPLATSAPLSQDVIQNLIQLIQNLLRQLGESSPSNQDDSDSDSKPKEEGGQDLMQQDSLGSEQDPESALGGGGSGVEGEEDTRRGIEGTSGDDKIKGTRGEDYIEGLAGNDRLSGRQGNDTLLGQEGNDRLYGGKGDDILFGGEGNDYLSGGRGDNQLFGGAGDDTLYHRRGSGTLDGGTGNDLARIRGNIDDYTITVENESPEYLAEINAVRGDVGIDNPLSETHFVLTSKDTGKSVVVRNTENFRFNDIRLTAEELKERADPANPPPQEDKLVSLTQAQETALLGIFGLDQQESLDAGVRVLDKNGDGKVSVGDEAVLSTGDASSVSQRFRTLSAEDVATINGEVITPDPDGTRLDLTQSQNDAISQLFNDIAPLAYDGQATEYTGAAFDKDGDNKLSAGDVVKLRIYGGNSPIPNETIVDHVLTVDEAAILNGDTPSLKLLDLSNEESQAISDRFDRTPGPNVADGFTIRFTGVAIDKNGDGKLSAGDVVKLHQTGGIAGVDQINDHILTDRDIAAIEAGSTTGEELTLDNKQKRNAFGFPRPFAGGNTVHIFDTNGDGKVSKGDVAVYSQSEPFFTPDRTEIEVGRITLSEHQAAIINGTEKPAVQIALDENKQKWADSGIEDYNYQFQRSCFCPSEIITPVNVTVSNGEVTDASFVDNNAITKPLVSEPPKENQQNVNGLFDIIQNAIDNGRQLDITYDAKTGMPTRIVIDSDQMPVDGGETITATDLQVTTGNSNLQARDDFESNLQKWKDSNTDNYSFTLTRSGFLAGDARKPVDLTVNGTEVTDAKFSDGTGGQVPEFNQLSIDDLFKTIGSALDNNAAEVRVTYNAKTGRPESIFIDQDQRIADEEIYLEASNFIDLDDVTDPVIDDVLQGQLDYLNGKTFYSERLLEVGVGAPTGPNDPGGVVLGRWEISFNDGAYQRSYSDVGEAGTYGIHPNGTELFLAQEPNNIAITGAVVLKVFPDEGIIEFNGIRYGEENGVTPPIDEPVFTTLALGEEDGGVNPPMDDPILTTQAIGEEDGGGVNPPMDDPILTTQAIGEEDGGGVNPPTDDPILTTQAIGEEDGGGVTPPTDDPILTTKALGEEDDGVSPPIDDPILTTQAIGEEDGGANPPIDEPTFTTLAVGEEDGGIDLKIA